MRDPWFQAFFGMPPTICGLRLLPYSVAHDYILWQMENPYALDLPGTEPALLEAVQICSRTYRQNREAYSDRGALRYLREIVRHARRWHRRMDFAIADASLKTYLADYRSVPEHKPPKPMPEGVDSYAAAPLHWHVVLCLCDHYGKTFEQAWDTAFNEAKCCFDVWAESTGDDSLESVTEQHVNELCREADRLAQAGKIEESDAVWDEVRRVCDLRMAARKESA